MDGNIAARHPDIAKDAARDSFFQLFGVSGCEDMCMEFSKDGKTWEYHFCGWDAPIFRIMEKIITIYKLMPGDVLWCRDSPTAKPFTMVVGRDVR